MRITFVGDPMDGKEKVTGYRVSKRWDDGQEREVVVRRPIKKVHKADDPASITMFNMKFVKGEPVEVPDDSEFAKSYAEKFEGNSHFLVERSEPEPVPEQEPEGDDQDTTKAG